MLFRNLLNKKYLIYGSSIIGTRGMEYLVLFFAAHYLSKESYGELEYYKKIIEVGSSVFAFGLPALIISYTKSPESKKYFFLLSILFVSLISLVSVPFLGLINWEFLLIPFLFYAIFFNGGITPSSLLVSRGSNYASIYKILISVVFYLILFIAIYFFDITGKAYVTACHVILPFAMLYIFYELIYQKLERNRIKKYWQIFKRLLLSSSTLVVSNFANMMFLYTDIFLIQVLSKNAKPEIADFSFALNISAMLLLVPLTLVQVDIETLKTSKYHFSILNKKIFVLTILSSIFLIGVYYSIIHIFFHNYANTFYLFLILLLAKLFHSLSSLFGTYLLILKKFQLNLLINVVSLLINIVLCYFGYYIYGLIGLAMASLTSLGLRYYALYYFKSLYSN